MWKNLNNTEMLKKICKLSGKYMILYGELDLQSSGLRKIFLELKLMALILVCAFIIFPA